MSIDPQLLKNIPARFYSHLQMEQQKMQAMDLTQLESYRRSITEKSLSNDTDGMQRNIGSILAVIASEEISNRGSINLNQSISGEIDLGTAAQRLNGDQMSALAQMAQGELEQELETCINPDRREQLERMLNSHKTAQSLYAAQKQWESDGKNPLKEPRLYNSQIVYGDPDAQVETDNTVADTGTDAGGDLRVVFND